VPRPVIRDEGVVVEGFAALQRVLKQIESGAHPELKKRLKVIGDHVAKTARGNVSHKTGRHFGSPRIESSIKVSVTARGASVYSTAPHGGVQNVGGRVGRSHLTVIKRAEVSGYMTKAVQSDREFVQHETEALVQWLLRTFQNGD
jgi:hypothetical protein